jgi:endonuclease YncB( thermonuclease family)
LQARRSVSPELKQPCGQRSNQTLSNQVFGRTVRVDDHGRDRYGRLLDRGFYRDLDVTAEMVRQAHGVGVCTGCNKPRGTLSATGGSEGGTVGVKASRV